jgi:hypothetical protein
MVIVDRLFHSVRLVVKKGSFNCDRSVRANSVKKLLPVHQSLGGDCMKKIIAISVMLLLIAGVVFADTSVGGNLKISANLLQTGQKGQAKNPDDVLAGGATIWDAYANVNWSGDNAGGMMRLFTKNNEWTPDFFVFWWWKPIEQLRLQVGKNADADWGHAQISGWGFNGEAQGGIAIDKDRELSVYPDNAIAALARTAAWWGGFGDLGIALSLFPAQGFEIDIGIPMHADKTDSGAGAIGLTKTAEQTYLSSAINFKYDLPDIGTIRLAAILQGKDFDDKVVTPNIHFAFYLSAIESMGLELGFAYLTEAAKSKTVDAYSHMEIGLGYRLDADDLSLKARLGVAMAPGDKDDGMYLGFNILPSYNLGSLTAYLNAGLGMMLTAPKDSNITTSDYMDFYFNPYIKVPANAGNFYAGIKVWQVKSLWGKESDMHWGIPIGWNVYF